MRLKRGRHSSTNNFSKGGLGALMRVGAIIRVTVSGKWECGSLVGGKK